MVGVKIRRTEKRERKIGWKMTFSLIWFRREIRETENGKENNLFGPTFFCPPNFGGKLRRKDGK